MTAAPSPHLTVALTFDHDAISSEVRRGDGPMTISRGEFGPRVGARRVLELLDREGIPSTWFVPGHTIETFPESVARSSRPVTSWPVTAGCTRISDADADGGARRPACPSMP
jgi:hypothetical protein